MKRVEEYNAPSKHPGFDEKFLVKDGEIWGLRNRRSYSFGRQWAKCMRFHGSQSSQNTIDVL